MNPILILYRSKYGATKRYAELLKEEIDCNVFDVKDFRKSDLKNYDRIIFAGAIYASGISGLNFLRQNYKDLRDKKTAVFCVGASPLDETALSGIKEHNLKGELKNIPLFYGRGAWDEESMTFKDRTLCKMLQKMVSKQDPESCEPWMKALLSAVGQKCDWTDRKYLIPLIEYITK